MKLILMAIMTLFLTCGGNDDDSIACTEQFVYGLNVTVKDASNNVILTEGITVIARDGNHEEELMHVGTDSFVGAGERAGNYIIEVTSINYQTYTSETSQLDADLCHVIPEVIEILLQPL